jgi:hypothetical protein
MSKAEKTHLNWMGGKSFDIQDPLLQLRVAASSCFFGEPQFYHQDPDDTRKVRAPRHDISSARASKLQGADLARLRESLGALDPLEWRSKTPAELIESVVDDALAHDAEATLKEAVRLRNQENMRTTPQVILVRAAHHKAVKGTGLVRKYAPEIIRRADEPSVGLAYHIFRFGEKTPIPNSLKKAWSDAFGRFKEYDLAKYRMSDRDVKTVDVVNLVHPKGEAVSKLVKNELKTTDLTWESIISKEGSTTETWTKALDVMGHMAMLKNLRNLVEKGVPLDLFVEKLLAGAPKGKQLPFRYFSAYRALKETGKAPGRLLEATEECLKLSLGNLPKLDGRVMSLADNSGSAKGATTSSMGSMSMASIANLTGILAAMRADEGHLGVFGDLLRTIQVTANDSIFKKLEEAEKLGQHDPGGTENGIWLFWEKAIREKQHWDHVFVFSDMQAGHGGLYGTDSGAYRDFQWSDKKHIDVGKLINAYRAKVNPNVNVFLVQVAGYKDTLLPEFYARTYILGGWGEGLLRFAAEMAKLIPAASEKAA